MADFNEITKTTDHTAEFDQADIQQNIVMGVLAYLSWLVLIPLLAAKESRFARFHCNQGLVLAIVEIVGSILMSILSAIPYLGILFGIIYALFGFGCFALSIVGIINAASGKAKELPLIGNINILT